MFQRGRTLILKSKTLSDNPPDKFFNFRPSLIHRFAIQNNDNEISIVCG